MRRSAQLRVALGCGFSAWLYVSWRALEAVETPVYSTAPADESGQTLCLACFPNAGAPASQMYPCIWILFDFPGEEVYSFYTVHR